jgi:hypothetical protein
MNKVIIFIFCVLILILFFKFKNIFTDKNAYLGVNTKCKYCMTYKGNHYHNFSTNLYPQYDNMASSGIHCHYCMEHPNEFHFHYLN